MKKLLPLTLVGGALAVVGTSAQAQVFVKPTGSKSVPVRVQKLRADVEITGALVITKWTMDIQMEHVGLGGWNQENAVSDFICARPRDAKVTAFSIGNSIYGRVEESGARLEERCFVAPRVAFRAAPNDPLLRSKLNAGNSFRATIYPLNTWSNVTVNFTWVQPLTSSRTGATYRLPLLALRGATTRLSELNTKITFRGGALPSVSNNYKLPLRTQNGARVLTLGQKNYRVLRDLTLTINPPKATAPIPTLVAPGTGAGTGHFALAFVAPRALRGVTVTGNGIEGITFSPKSARAGEVVQVSGLYKGDLKDFNAKLSATGLPSTALTPVQSQTASALWATQKINALNASAAANRAQIIALSKRYSVVSAFTSWLAVSEEDRKIYRRALVSSQLDPLVREYWVRVSDGQEKGARATQLKNAIARISTANGLKTEDELYVRLGSATNYLAWKGWYYGEEPKTRDQKRFARLRNTYQKYLLSLNVKTETYDGVTYPDTRGELGTLREQIVAEYRKPHPDFAQLDKWEYRFAQIYGAIDVNPRLSYWRQRIDAQNLEARTTAAEQKGDSAQLGELQNARNENSRRAYFTNNIGDPPIYVSAPADARQVVAVMPDGKIKTLDYNQREKRWEGNYDVPVGTRDGDYKIEILVVNANGSRRRYAMPFRVDTKAPSGKGSIELAPTQGNERAMRLEVEHSGDVAVVVALLPWGEKVNLLPSTVRSNTFFGSARVPRDYAGEAVKVTYILVDRAHNTTSIETESATPSP